MQIQNHHYQMMIVMELLRHTMYHNVTGSYNVMFNFTFQRFDAQGKTAYCVMLHKKRAYKLLRVFVRASCAMKKQSTKRIPFFFFLVTI